jgi:hypothetical protein
MTEWGRNVDRLLRGGFTSGDDLAQGRIQVSAGQLAATGVALGAVYGVFMGLYGVLRSQNPSVAQLFATIVKVPLLFFLTLVVTFPSLYVFSALRNSRLRFEDTLKLLLVAVAVNAAVLASLGPVTGFFTLSTESYPFMIVLNVLLFTAAGLVALAFLKRCLSQVFAPLISTEVPAPRKDPTRGVFAIWIVIYAVVGAQMGWILRPFIGTPDAPFTLFRPRQASFFEGFFRALGNLFG